MIKIRVPGDKSISHRAIMLASLAQGTSQIDGFLRGDDCLATISSFRKLGVEISRRHERVFVKGNGLDGLKEPNSVLDVGNSGTTIRLISGILAGQPFTSFLTGDASIRKRPMKRVIDPLSLMGAEFMGRQDNNLAPFAIRGGSLKAIDYTSPVASAQIKSAVLLAGLFADGVTIVREPEKSRNHTELILASFGAKVKEGKNFSSLEGRPKLLAQKIEIPGDISSAAFFMVAGLIVPGADIFIENVGLNESRTGIIDVLREMGGKIEISNERVSSGEKIGDVRVVYSQLKAVKFGGEIIPRLVDEIPVLALAASQAQGRTIIYGAEELKVKETDRLHAISKELSKLGAKIEEKEDGLIIDGPVKLKYAECESYNDHRIAMTCALAGLLTDRDIKITNPSCVDISFPGFFELLQQIKGVRR